MHLLKYACLFCACNLIVPAFTAQAQPAAPKPQSNTLTQPQSASISVTKDPQAVNIFNQSLSATGGSAAIQTIVDYTATGTVTYYWNPEEQGAITIQALGLTEIRSDSSLPSGEHSESIQAGEMARKRPDGKIWKYPPQYSTPSSEAFAYQPPMFPGSLIIPYSQLIAILNNPRYGVSFKGSTQLDGVPVYDIQAQLMLAGQPNTDVMAEYRSIEFFIDSSSLQIVMTQDSVPNHIVHRIRYANYRPVNGVLIPFSISEETGGQKTKDIQLSQITINGGLQDSAFSIQ